MFSRARGDLRLEDAARKVSYFHPVSDATISRMENRDTPPVKRSQRHTAYVACVIYGIDPDDLGLDGSDLPPGTLKGLNTAREVVKAQGRCIGRVA